jgi:hypothetical protein
MPPESTFTIPPEILVPELGAPLTRPGDPAYYGDASLVPPQQMRAAPWRPCRRRRCASPRRQWRRSPKS